MPVPSFNLHPSTNESPAVSDSHAHLVNVDAISSLLRARQTSPVARPSWTISAPLTARAPSTDSSRGSESDEELEMLTPDTSVTHFTLGSGSPTPTPSKAALRGVERALPPLPPLKPTTISFEPSPPPRAPVRRVKPPVPTAPKPSAMMARAQSVRKTDISGPQASRIRTISGSDSAYSPTRAAPSPLTAPLPSQPEDSSAFDDARENPYALHPSPSGKRLSGLQRALSRSPAKPSASPTPSKRERAQAPPPSAFALGSLAAARTSTSSLASATGRGVRRMLSFSRDRGHDRAEQHHAPGSDDDGEAFELVQAPHDAAYRGALAFGAPLVADPQRERPVSRLSMSMPERPASRLVRLISISRPSSSAHDSVPAKTAVLLRDVPPAAFERVRAWAAQHGPLSALEQTKKGIRVVWRTRVADSVCPGASCSVLIDRVGMVRVETVRVK